MACFLIILFLAFAAGIILYLHRLIRCSTWGLTWTDIAAQSLPRQDFTRPHCPEHYLIKQKNRFELQGENKCGGYAAAFLLRSLGTPVSGEEVYRKMDYRLSSGYVLPQALLDALADRGFDAVLCRCSLEQLKTHVSGGIPVIVLLGDGEKWQHYANVVGYDTENVLLFDSLCPGGSAAYYNRVMTYDEFLEQWNNGIPLFQRVCVVIRSASAPSGPRRTVGNI